MGAQASLAEQTCCTEGPAESVYNINGPPVSYAAYGATASGLVHSEYDPKASNVGAGMPDSMTSKLGGGGFFHTGGITSSPYMDQKAGLSPPPYIQDSQDSRQQDSLPIPPHLAHLHLDARHDAHNPAKPLQDPRQLEDKAADKVAAAGPDGLQKALAATRAKMRAPENDAENATGKNNKYGGRDAKFPAFLTGKHIPTLALVNPKSGETVGEMVLSLSRRCPIYQDRFFNIVAVAQDCGRGGLLDVFRLELNAAKEEARLLGTRPRVISGGGDGTGTFTLHVLFKALQADNSRADESPELRDTGNGFIWTDAEMRESFPALAQMPLGSANDFANILGWGQKYPGSVNGCSACCAATSVFCNKRTKQQRFRRLLQWLDHVIDPASQVCNFDVWGIMPMPQDDKCNFKLAELGGRRGRSPKSKIDGKQQLTMKEASKPTPFFIMLYFSTGFGGYLCSRFSINRRTTPFRNRLEYVRQSINMLMERTPPQTLLRTNGVRVDCTVRSGAAEGDTDSHGNTMSYFPPRRGKKTKGSRYREVGFYNINWQAHALHGADRAPLIRRLFFSKRRRPVKFNDGLLDMYRMRLKSWFKNPGVRMQTDKRVDMTLSYEAAPGKGIFVQYDGEARFVFSPTGEQFNLHIRKVLNIPVVIGPFVKEKLTGNLKEDGAAFFEISGDTPELKERVRRRLLKSLQGGLDTELNATAAEIAAAKLPVYETPHDHATMRAPAPKNPKKFHNADED